MAKKVGCPPGYMYTKNKKHCVLIFKNDNKEYVRYLKNKYKNTANSNLINLLVKNPNNTEYATEVTRRLALKDQSWNWTKKGINITQH